jgi:hypothetical protein
MLDSFNYQRFENVDWFSWRPACSFLMVGFRHNFLYVIQFKIAQNGARTFILLHITLLTRSNTNLLGRKCQFKKFSNKLARRAKYNGLVIIFKLKKFFLPLWGEGMNKFSLDAGENCLRLIRASINRFGCGVLWRRFSFGS